MARLIYEHDDGTQVVIRGGLPDKKVIGFRDALWADDYIAMKLWSKEDLYGVIADVTGREAREEDVTAVLAAGYLNSLCEPTEQDWQVINDAVSQTFRKEQEDIVRSSDVDIRYFNLKFGFEDQYIAIVPKGDGTADFVMLVKDIEGFWLYTEQISESDIPADAWECDTLVRTLATQNSGGCERFYSMVALRMSDTYLRHSFVLDRLIANVPGEV